MKIQGKFWGHLGLFLLVLSLLTGFGFRSFIANRTHSLLAGCNWCFIAPAWAHDLLVLALALGLAGILLLSRGRLGRVLAGIPLLILVTLFWLDVIVYHALNYRVRIEDVLLFSHETRAIVTFIQALRSSVEGMFPVVAGACGVLGGMLFTAFAPNSPVLGRSMIFAALLAGGLHLAAYRADPDYVFNDAILSYIEINYPTGVDKSYATTQPATPPRSSASEAKYCFNGSGLRPRNVILLVIESLSGYHSKLIVGNDHHGYTPFLDKLAGENSYFTNFFANGFTTDGGLISLLTGRFPVPSVGRYRSVDAFEGFSCIADSYPKFMKSQGYSPVFFSNSSLEFTNLGGWAQSIGFDYVEGPTHPFYARWEKGLFDAVEDRALFLRFMDWLDHDSAGKPYAAVLMTHSTHPPFVDPVTKAKTEVRVYRYMDQSVEFFVSELARRGYFSSGGLLLITGDHRGYTPISKQEQDLFGESARARIPFIVVGNSGLPKGKNSQYAQQADLLGSMKALVGKQAFSMPPNRGLFLGAQRREPQFVFHASGKDRDQIKVFYPDASIATIKLNGDETAWLGKSPENRQEILDALALDRMSRGKATVNYVDYLYKVTFDNRYGGEKFAQGSRCSKNTPAPGY
jgi:hypothetical protein